MMKWRQSITSSLMLTDIDWRANIYKKEDSLCETFVTIVVVNRKYKSFADKKYPTKNSEFLRANRVIQQISLWEACKRQPQK